MKRAVIFLFALFLSLSTYAQGNEVSDYTKLENLVNKINDLLRLSDGKRVIYRAANQDAILYYPEINFMINFQTLLVTGIIGNSEVGAKSASIWEVFADVDISDIKNIIMLDDQLGDFRFIYLELPKPHLYKKHNGKQVSDVEIKAFPFFVPRGKENELINALSELVYLIKVKKGMLTAREAER